MTHSPPIPFPPRYPVPRHISPEAQAVLSQSVDMRPAQAAPASAEEWRSWRESTEGMFRPMIEQAIAGSGVRVAKATRAGVLVRELTPPPPRDPHPGRVLMNLHGGGYTIMGGDLSVIEGLGLAMAGYRVVSVDYRMPPDHPFPAAVEDGVAVYRDLLDAYDPGQIALFGSSAGGGLTAAVIVAARDAGLPLPAATVLHTPWCDLSKTGDSYFTNEGVDPMLTTYDGGLEAGARAYAGDAGLSHPLVSPIYADLSKGFPPSFLSTGTRDLLLSCTVRLHRALRAVGVQAELHVFEAMWHGFSAMPEGRELDREVLAFLQSHLDR